MIFQDGCVHAVNCHSTHSTLFFIIYTLAGIEAPCNVLLQLSEEIMGVSFVEGALWMIIAS